ncbi:endolytic transglycosylase MltG, partial [Klebsiella pneumoniae]
KPGTGLGSLARQLAKAGVVDNALFFDLWVRTAGNYQHYQAGTYRFSGLTSPADVESRMLRGDVYNPVVVQIAVPEGMRMHDIVERLAAN